jgi:hypothetical protein
MWTGPGSAEFQIRGRFMTFQPSGQRSKRSYFFLWRQVLASGALLWRFIGWIWGSIILGGLAIGMLVSYLITGTTGLSNPDPRTWFIVRPLLQDPLRTGFGLVITLILTASAYFSHRAFRDPKSSQRIDVSDQQRVSPYSTQQNRRRLLKRVRATWIAGLLDQSLHRAVWIDLHLQEQPHALENPWRLHMQEFDRASQPLPAGTSIVEVYDQADGELLILGEPGAGKTTLLLELTRTLLERAEKDEQLPMPIVFNLSSWAEKRQPLQVWLVEEFRTKYQVPRKIAQEWMDADQVLPLLDGLDEVTEEARSACVQHINDYYQAQLERGRCPIVVCCRSKEYAVLSTCMMFQRAVSILPLTDEQITIYLEHAGEQARGLSKALSEDGELHELVRQPLMLNIFTLAYQGTTQAEVSTGGTREEIRDTIFARYVRRVLMRHRQPNRWEPKDVIHWLAFLAKQMHQHNQTVLCVENLQPDWLPGKQQRLYHSSVKLLFGLAGWVLFGLGIGLGGALGNGLYFGLSIGLTFGLIGGVLFWSSFRVGHRIQLTEIITWSWKDARRRLLIGLISGVFFGLIVGIPFGLLFTLGVDLGAGLQAALLSGLNLGLLFGLVCVLVGMLSTTQMAEKHRFTPNEGIWRSAKNGMSIGFLSGPALSLIGVLSFHGLFFDRGGPLVRPLVGLIIGLTIGLIRVVAKVQLTEKGHLALNEGIRQTVKDILIIGLLGGLAVGLPFVPGIKTSRGLVGGLGITVGDSLAGTLIIGLTSALIFGLSSFVHHFLLRFFLWRSNCLPWDLIPFLDEAVARLLLRKVGGSYVFMHRLLLEYFSSTDDPDISCQWARPEW